MARLQVIILTFLRHPQTTANDQENKKRKRREGRQGRGKDHPPAPTYVCRSLLIFAELFRLWHTFVHLRLKVTDRRHCAGQRASGSGGSARCTTCPSPVAGHQAGKTLWFKGVLSREEPKYFLSAQLEMFFVGH